MTAPYKFLKSGHDIEKTYLWWQNLIAAVTPGLGLVLLVASLLVLRGSRPASPVSPADLERKELTPAT
ncbi:hypothetical protein [Microlunatus endophyticus]